VHSSVNFPLPEVGDEPEPLMGPVKLGVTVEDAIMLPPPPDDRRVERVALRVARDPIL
jgi:protein Hikeshi